jgi:hypothetical protein
MITARSPYSVASDAPIRCLDGTSVSLSALTIIDQLQQRESRQRLGNLLRLGGGLAIVLAIMAGVYQLAMWAPPNRPAPAGLEHTPAEQQMDAIQFVLIFNTTILLVTYLIATFTRKESRSEMINQFIETGHYCGPRDNPVSRIILILILLGLFYGQFLIIDVLKAMSLHRKLNRIDRNRAAIIVGMLMARPAGIDPRALLRINENPTELRRVLAYLMTYKWIDISPQGDYLNLRSQGRER